MSDHRPASTSLQFEVRMAYSRFEGEYIQIRTTITTSLHIHIALAIYPPPPQPTSPGHKPQEPKSTKFRAPGGWGLKRLLACWELADLQLESSTLLNSLPRDPVALWHREWLSGSGSCFITLVFSELVVSRIADCCLQLQSSIP